MAHFHVLKLLFRNRSWRTTKCPFYIVWLLLDDRSILRFNSAYLRLTISCSSMILWDYLVCILKQSHFDKNKYNVKMFIYIGVHKIINPSVLDQRKYIFEFWKCFDFYSVYVGYLGFGSVYFLLRFIQRGNQT